MTFYIFDFDLAISFLRFFSSSFLCSSGGSYLSFSLYFSSFALFLFKISSSFSSAFSFCFCFSAFYRFLRSFVLVEGVNLKPATLSTNLSISFRALADAFILSSVVLKRTIALNEITLKS